MKRNRKLSYSVEVVGQTRVEELYDIEAESSDEAEKIGRDKFRDEHGNDFDSIKAFADNQ